MAGVVGAVDGEGGHLAVEVGAVDGAADDEVVAAPAVVGAVSIGAIRAAEVGGGEGGDLIGDPEFDGGVVEGVHGLADLREEPGVGAVDGIGIVELSGVGVPPAELDEENLALEAEGG